MTDVKTEEAPKKKTYVKRKNEILKDIEVVDKKELVEEPVSEEKGEPPTKKTRITDDNDCSTEALTPSWLRGAIIKPLLLGLVASLSFWVNNFYQTHHQTPVVKKNSQTSEIKKSLQRPLPVFENNTHRQILVPGFTTN